MSMSLVLSILLAALIVTGAVVYKSSRDFKLAVALAFAAPLVLTIIVTIGWLLWHAAIFVLSWLT